MKATELITELERIIEKWGDAEIYAHHEDEVSIDTAMHCETKIVLSQW